MKIAVTGATGHIGSNLCPLLVEKGHTLKVLVYSSVEGLPEKNIEQIRGDITNLNDVDNLIKGSDAVIHLAAKISIEKDKSGMVDKINRSGTEHVVESCINHKIKRLIHFSSIHTFDPFPLEEALDETRAFVVNGSDYDRSKIAGERAVQRAEENGVETITLCPTSVFGPNDYQPSLLGSAIVDMYNGRVPVLVPGGYDFVDVRDVAKGTLLALEKGKSGEKYLMGGHYLTIKELAAKIAEIGKIKVTKRVLPIGVLRVLLPFFKLQGWLTNKPPLFTHESLKALTESNPYINCQKAMNELGYTKTSIDQSLRDTLDWFSKTGKLKVKR